MGFLLFKGPDIGSWVGLTWKGLNIFEWILFLRLGLAGLFMICIEWWYVELYLHSKNLDLNADVV
jgi:hypothetical protein